jgi:hypothetical protein
MRNADLVALCHAMCVCVRLAAALILLVPALATAQATGTISGLETDSTDAALPAVALEVTNLARARTKAVARQQESTRSVTPRNASLT